MPLPEILTRVRVVLVALPARLAALAAVLSVASVEIVPLLPAPIAAKVAAWIVAALAAIAYATKVIARLTLVPDAAIGLFVPEGKQLYMELVGKSWPAGHGPDNPPTPRLHSGGIVPTGSDTVRIIHGHEYVMRPGDPRLG